MSGHMGTVFGQPCQFCGASVQTCADRWSRRDAWPACCSPCTTTPLAHARPAVGVRGAEPTATPTREDDRG